jgi:predicted ATPase
VYTVHVDPDEKRELLTLYVTGRDHTPHPARALSDGTLRFLALAVAELDPESQGLLFGRTGERHPSGQALQSGVLRSLARHLA